MFGQTVQCISPLQCKRDFSGHAFDSRKTLNFNLLLFTTTLLLQCLKTIPILLDKNFWSKTNCQRPLLLIETLIAALLVTIKVEILSIVFSFKALHKYRTII